MNLFEEWSNNYNKGKSDYPYILKFLADPDDSKDVFENGTDQEQKYAFEVLNYNDLDIFLEAIKWLQTKEDFIPADVPLYSEFKDGAIKTPEILLFDQTGLTFQELGYQLIRAEQEAAQRKYGETHAKLARMMSLVAFDSSRPVRVKITPWGAFLAKYSFEKKASILKKLLLRDPYIQAVIQGAEFGNVSYRELTRNLAHETAYRRRTCTKILINFILKDSSYEGCLSNIDWVV